MNVPITDFKLLDGAVLPRLQPTLMIPTTSTPVSVLQTHSNEPKNVRFGNKNEHRYPLQYLTLLNK